MRTRPSTPRILPALALAACWACSSETPGAPPASLVGALSGSSVLLITLDTTRADALGCYGGPDWSSPRLDALAAEGVRFDQARSTSPVTLPSHATILTGLRPFEHGVRDNGTFRLPARALSLAERLGAAGYSTAAVTGAFVLHSDFGLAQGFTTYSNVPRRKLEMDTVEDQRTATEVVDAALGLVESGALEPPFFLWTHLFDPHRPLNPPEPYRSRALEGVSEQTPYQVVERRFYHAEVAYADEQIGRLLVALRAHAGDDLLVVFCSDHGEGFGDHGEPAHGLQVYDTTMRVPLLLQHPRLPAGRVIERHVSTADLAPTVLALVGLDREGTSGRDLSPLLVDPTATLAGADDGEALYLETCHSFYSYGWSPLFALIEDGLKVIVGPSPAVYDLAADPGEHVNLVSERGAALERARAGLASLAAATRAGERIELDDASRQALEQLGYTAGADGGEAAPILPGRIDPDLLDPAEQIQMKELCQMAVSQMAAGNLQRAVQDLRRVLEGDPRNPIFLSQAGTIFITAGLLDEAKVALTRALEHREDPSARCSLAVAHNLSGQKDMAIATLEHNVARPPHHLHTRFALGELLLERGRAGDAQAALTHFEAFLAEHAADDAWNETARALAHRARTAARDQGPGERR